MRSTNMFAVRVIQAGAAALVVTTLAACSKRDAAADSAKAADSAMHAGHDMSAMGGPTATKVGETTDLSTPESVRYDADQDVFFVSNIEGNPSQKDGKGSIRKVRADSMGKAAAFIESGKNGVTLNAPKGLAIQGDTLWVADLDAVRAFNRRTGAPIASIDLKAQKATFLNDIVVGGDGAIYVTDTGIAFDEKGNITHPGVNRIFKITGRTVSEAATGDALNNPNGITWDAKNGRFLLAPFAGNDVQMWTPGSAPAKLASGPGQFDGIEVLGDNVLVTSWTDNTVQIIKPSATAAMALIQNVKSPADIGVDTKRNVVAVPLFTENKVEYYSVK